MQHAASIGASRNVHERWRQALAVMVVFFLFCACVQKSAHHDTFHGAQHRLVPAHGLGKELHGLLFDEYATKAAGSRCLPCSHLV